MKVVRWNLDLIADDKASLTRLDDVSGSFNSSSAAYEVLYLCLYLDEE